MNSKKISCSRCILTSEQDPALTISEEGICNHCEKYMHVHSFRVLNTVDGLQKLVERIKTKNSEKKYDCIVGVSGGVDSSFVLHLVASLNLRPLAVHVDNGWNSTIAVKNIKRIVDALNVDLHTHVLDWEEFSSIQLSFLKAGVPDGEVPTDHAISTILYELARKHDVGYIISGLNASTETTAIDGWSYGHMDSVYLEAVYQSVTGRKFKKFPHLSIWRLLYLTGLRRIRSVNILNYISYNKNEAIEILAEKYGWERYSGKHHESTYTRFYQSFVLPKFFNIDKRFCHLSDLISANQISRSEAMNEISKPHFNEIQARIDMKYVANKFCIDSELLHCYLSQLPKRNYRKFKNVKWLIGLLKFIVDKMRAYNIYAR